MHINFLKVKIEGFQSIGDSTVLLSNQGIVSIKGINNYEENSDSNGAGKSSIFESILFAIYGKTSSGVSNPSNRNLGSGCSVELFFNIGNNEYRILRTIDHHILKTSLHIFKDDEDISSRNKTDTQKIIENIFDCSQDIFTSTIYLNQGLNSRLSALQPSGRKSRLESLADISEKIDSFKRKVMNHSKTVLDEYNKACIESSRLSGVVESVKSSIKSVLEKMDRYSKENADKKDDLQNLINYENKILLSLQNEKQYIDRELFDRRKKKEFLSDKLQNLERMLKDSEDSLRNISDVCPTCGQKIPADVYNDSISSKERTIKKLKKSIASTVDMLDEVCPKVLVVEEEQKVINDKITISKNKITEYEKSLFAMKDNNSSNLKALNEILDSNKDLMKQTICKQREVKSQIVDISRRKDVIESISNYISRDFRTWMLNNVIHFINSRLHHYSDVLFSNSDVIRILEDRNKVDIYVGNAKYETLSGGEKRRVDLAITLAERDLAINVAGISSNIIILDEVFDNLDDKGIQTSVKMFTKECMNSDSMFIISHKSELNIPSDYSLLVIKERNKVSHIERM